MKTETKRKEHNAAFKATVGMEAILGIKTVAQIAQEYGIHPVKVSQWKAGMRCEGAPHGSASREGIEAGAQFTAVALLH